MHILIVDDWPELKVQHAIQYMKSQNIDFTYQIVKSYNSAGRYIVNHLHEIDLAIVDLGLPRFDDGVEYGKLEGLIIVDMILRKKTSIPIIINSTTEIPNEEEFLERYTDRNAVIKHVTSLNGEWLVEFIKNLHLT